MNPDQMNITIGVDGESPVGDMDVELADLTLDQILEAEKEAKIERLVKLRALVNRLAAKRDQSILDKRDIEMMAVNSIRLYEGNNSVLGATKDHPVGSVSDGAPTPHLLRAKTDQWQARICDMISANPWDLEPDPMTTSQAAADAMRLKIQGQLDACHFDRSLRSVARDAARLGTGVMMGPRNATKRRRRYQPAVQVPGEMPMGGGSAMQLEESIAPDVEHADFWCFFPDMVANIEDAEFAHYVHLLGPLAVKNLAPDFDQDQINALLRSDADLGHLRGSLAIRNQYLTTQEITKDRYAVWRYTGVLDKEDLETLELCGCDDAGEEGETTAPPMAMADVWYCQDFILRAKLAPVPDDFRIPYFVYAPFPIEGTMFGRSLPSMGEDSQRVAKASWNIGLHNASVSSGSMILSRAGKMKPTDGKYEIRGPKHFQATDPDLPLQDTMQVFNVPNMVEQAFNIYDRASELMDVELNTRDWANPETSSEHPTASGLAMVMNSNSILQLMVAAQADDGLFEPVIERFCWWNNDNDPDESIKGDFIVKPLVQSQRLVKDVQAQHAMAYATMTDNPRFAKYSKDYELLKYVASFMDGPIDNLVKDESQVQQEEQNPQPDPMQVQTELLNAKVQVELIKAQNEGIDKSIKLIELQMAQAQTQAGPDGPDPSKMTELDLKAQALQIQREKVASSERVAIMKDETADAQNATRVMENRRKEDEDRYERQQAQQTKLMMEGMKTEREAQEINLKRETGSGI